MRPVAPAALLVAATISAFAQRPVAQAQASAAPTENVCAKAVTIYLDASGTMTQPMRNRGNRLPISDIAQTLLRFVSAENFLAAGDTVTIKYFGSAVRTQAENRQASVALLTQLADPVSAPTAANALKSSDLNNLTDFSRLFDDVENRLRNAPLRRQIIFIASDFAHDPLNNRGCPNDVAPRLESFASAFNRIRSQLEAARTPTGDQFSRAEIAGLFAPEGACGSDNEVGRQVQAALQSVGMRLYRYDEDAAEAALTINNQMIGPVTAQPATAGVVRVGADNRVPFQVANPNCVDASVVALQFDAGGTSQRVSLTAPVIVSGRSEEIRLDADKLSSVWNRETRVSPVIAPGTSLSVEPSELFWLGDWIRVRRLTPYLYPRTFRQGETLVAATVERSLRSPAGLTVGGVDAVSRSRLFELPEGDGEELYLLPFNLNSALAGRLAGVGASASLGTTGIRLLTDETTAVANATWPLTTGATSGAAQVIDSIAAGSLASALVLFLFLVFRTFSREDEAEAAAQFGVLFARSRTLGLSAFASGALLLSRFGTRFVPDGWMFVLAGWRAVAVFAAVCLLLRAILVQEWWKRGVEPRLLPTDRAIRSRRWWNGLIYTAAFLASIAVLYTFFWGPASSPPPGAPVVKGVTR